LAEVPVQFGQALASRLKAPAPRASASPCVPPGSEVGGPLLDVEEVLEVGLGIAGKQTNPFGHDAAAEESGTSFEDHQVASLCRRRG